MNDNPTLAHQLLTEFKETINNSDRETYRSVVEICKNSNNEETLKLAIESISKSNQNTKVLEFALTAAVFCALICYSPKSSKNIQGSTYEEPCISRSRQQRQKVRPQ